MLAYVHDPNAIMTQHLKSRSTNNLVNAYSRIFSYLKSRGLAPTFQKCDNECPTECKQFLEKKGVTLQLAQQYDHRTNPARKAIDTFKCHFIPGFFSVASSSPLHLW